MNARMLSVAIAVSVGCHSNPPWARPVDIADASIDSPTCAFECNCNPFAQVGCYSDDYKCTWIVDENGTGSSAALGHVGCAPDGPIPAGGQCEAADANQNNGHDRCAKGTFCASGFCRPLCELAQPDACGDAGTCASVDGTFEYGGVYFAGVCP